MDSGTGSQRRAAPDTIESLDSQIKEQARKLGDARGAACFPLLLRSASIGPSLVDDIFDDLRENYSECKSIDVVIDSGGGDLDAAFNIALLLRRYATERLAFVVPRWAKSAATLLVCAGDEILMTPPAELGPLDPQITETNALEKRVEQFSPLHIESTLQLIRDEFEKGNEKLAAALMNRLQFPLTLGAFRKSLDISQQYLIDLLSTRMLRDKHDEAKKIAKKLTTGYADHGYCIKAPEAKSIGLEVVELAGDQLDIAWNIHKLNKTRERLERQQRQRRVREKMKGIPSEILDSLPTNLLGGLKGAPSNASPAAATAEEHDR